MKGMFVPIKILMAEFEFPVYPGEGVEMKGLQNLLIGLVLLLAGGWACGNLRAEDRTSGAVVEPKTRPGRSHGRDETVSPAGQLPRVQERLMSDEAVLEKIQALKDDPDVQAVLNDTELMEALKTGDLNAVISNPKFMKLLESPEIQEIIEEVR